MPPSHNIVETLTYEFYDYASNDILNKYKLYNLFFIDLNYVYMVLAVFSLLFSEMQFNFLSSVSLFLSIIFAITKSKVYDINLPVDVLFGLCYGSFLTYTFYQRGLLYFFIYSYLLYSCVIRFGLSIAYASAKKYDNYNFVETYEQNILSPLTVVSQTYIILLKLIYWLVEDYLLMCTSSNGVFDLGNLSLFLFYHQHFTVQNIGTIVCLLLL